MSKKEKLNLYKLKSKMLHRKYNIKLIKEKNNTDIIFLLNKYIYNLKEINNIYKRADIESLKYNDTNYPDTIYNNYIVNYYSFYITIIGYIDGNIDTIKRNIKENIVILDIFNNFRETIINDLKSNKEIYTIKIIDNLINTNPCYLNITNYFNEIKYDIYSKNIELDIILSYINGYKKSLEYSIISVYETYLNLINEYKNYIDKNKQEVENVRKKYLKNK